MRPHTTGMSAPPTPAWRLGASLALSGPEARYGEQLQQAIQLALEDENLPLSVLRVEDDGSDEARAGIVARTFAADARVLGVVGPMNSWTCAVQGPICRRAGLAQITPSASNPALAASGWETFFQMCPDDLVQGRVLARVAQALIGARRVAAIHDRTAFAEPLADVFFDEARAIGLEAGASIGVNDQGRYTEAALAIAAAEPDAVLVAGLEDPCRHAALALRERGVHAPLLGTDAIKPTLALVTPSAPGPYLTNSGTDARHQAPGFHRRFEDRFGRHDSIYTVETYDAARVLLQAIRQADGTRAGVLTTVRAAGPHVGLSGPVRFGPSGERLDTAIGVYRHDGDRLTYLGSHEQVLPGAVPRHGRASTGGSEGRSGSSSRTQHS